MAADNATTLTASPLAPSELVLLNGESFTTAQILLGRTGDPQVTLLHADVDVSAPQLGQAILAVMLLANEQAGAIKLDPRQKKTMFGLSASDTLFADPIDKAATWPAGSLEARLRPVVDRLQADGDKHEVVNVITELLPQVEEPWTAVAGLVIEGLASRDLLEAAPLIEEEDGLKRWVLPAKTRELAAQQKLGPVEQLITDAQRDKQEVWKRLMAQMAEAVAQQTRPSGG